MQRLARLAATLVYREVDIHRHPGSDLGDGPVLAVSNHFGGLADGVLLIDSAPRMPRVVARDAIWKVPLVGRIATGIGMIPVHKPEERPGSSNDQMFASAYRALGEQDLVLIFPEGVTMDSPHMAEVRTGAARIALGAWASGVAGIRIVPVGLHYEDKAGFRSRALVNIGEPIDVDSWVQRRGGVTAGADDRLAVQELTGLIDRRLRLAAPDFPDWETVHALHQAARVVLADVEPTSAEPLRYGDVELLAARLNRSDEPQRTRLIAAAGEYRARLRAAGTSDRAVAEIVGREVPRKRRWIADLLLVVVLLPFAVAGVLAAALPLGLVVLVSRAPLAPAVRATLVPGVALLAFTAEWIWLAWSAVVEDGWNPASVSVLLFPFFVGSLLVFAELATLLWRSWRARRRPSAASAPALAQQRSQLADMSWAAL